MGVESSQVSIEDIKTIVFNYYGFNVNQVEVFANSSATVYKIYTSNYTYILKEVQSQIQEEQIVREIQVCQYLLRKGYIVPKHIRTIQKKYWLRIRKHFFYMYEWIAGKPFCKYSGEKELLEKTSIHYAKLIMDLSDLKIAAPQSNIGHCSKEMVLNSIRNHNKLKNIINDVEVREKIQKKINRIYRLVDKNDYYEKGITYMLSHGDYNTQQLLLTDDGRIATLDFLSVKYMPISFELFRAYIFFARDFVKGNLDINQLVNYINKFKGFVNLTNEDILQMLPMYYYRILLSTFGYEQYALSSNYNTSKFYLELGNELYDQMCFVEKYLSASESILKLVTR